MVLFVFYDFGFSAIEHNTVPLLLTTKYATSFFEMLETPPCRFLQKKGNSVLMSHALSVFDVYWPYFKDAETQ